MKRQRFVRALPCSCKREKDDDGRPRVPDIATCGACGFRWCDRCNPTPSARCPNEVNHVADDDRANAVKLQCGWCAHVHVHVCPYLARLQERGHVAKDGSGALSPAVVPVLRDAAESLADLHAVLCATRESVVQFNEMTASLTDALRAASVARKHKAIASCACIVATRYRALRAIVKG